MRVVFMGSAPFALPALEALVREGHQIPLVVTRIDKPVGRGQEISQTPVKALALARGLPVFQPKTLRDPAVHEVLRGVRPDAIIVVAYGRILPPEVLAIPPLGCINVHGSLLPRWRGAAPVQWAVIAGDTVSGVTVMQMDEGLDTGPMLIQQSTAIGPDETAESLYRRLADLGAPLLLEALRGLATGTVVPRPQPEEGVTLAPPLKKEDGLLDWTKPRKVLVDRMRGVEPWPGSFSFGPGGIRLRWFPPAIPGPGGVGPGSPGTVVALDQGILWVQAGDGLVGLREVQPAGGRRMAVRDLLAGRRLKVGDLLGSGASDPAS
ncbi:MAG TPA: methionyl-tRNA formyltransferase [Myxococcota bacterium]|nr:methionyl-tRNA formyltransferase [Myxococcota bacterium]HQK52430.1 methionyl-tRNA formyltransferase [Myxococcota bacterium]